MRTLPTRKDQFDRSLINSLKVGSTFSRDWFTSLCKPVGKKLKKKLQRHGWKLAPLHLAEGPSFKVVTAEPEPEKEPDWMDRLAGKEDDESFSFHIDPQL